MADAGSVLHCRDVVDLVTERFEDALPAERAARWDEHVAACDGCAAFVAQFRTTIRAVRALPTEPASEARERMAPAWRAARDARR